MIYIDRNRVLKPSFYTSGRYEHLLEQSREFFASEISTQQRIRISPIRRHVRPVLRDLFNDKCAYCESPIGRLSSGDIDQFRPKGSIRELDGSTIPLGYWWLAYDWDNQYLSCEICNRQYKRNYFPILGSRGQPEERGTELKDKEQPLLIDPCDDNPAEYLLFDRISGKVRSITLLKEPGTEGRKDRAAVTIEVLGLNRREIREYRKHTILQKVRPIWGRRYQNLKPLMVTDLCRYLDEILHDSQSYLGILRQAVAEWYLRFSPDWPPKAQSEIRKKLKQLHVNIELFQNFQFMYEKASTEEKRKAAKRVKLEGPGQAYIKRIHLKNFKAIQKLDLNLDPLKESDETSGFDALLSPETETTQDRKDQSITETGEETASRGISWTVFLGENGVGKSSILEAISLALMGKKSIQALIDSGRIQLNKLIYRSANTPPEKNRRVCKIELDLISDEIPKIELKITRKRFEFLSGGAEVNTIVRGYGFVRLMPRKGEGDRESKNYIRCDNLFDPRSPLCDIDSWMLSLCKFGTKFPDTDRTSTFNLAATTINELLPQQRKTMIDPILAKQKIVMQLDDRPFDLDELSAGYGSIITLAADIMSGIPKDKFPDMRQAQGIVLLDEIGTQLHPRWRMQVVKDLKKAFRKFQFIATTHEPLCVKGLRSSEVVVLHQNGNGGIIFEQGGDRDPRTMRVDQILTSRIFGLDCTIDSEVDRLYQQYYELLLIKNPTEEQITLRNKLKAYLAPHRGLGYTRVDQLAYEILDEFLAKEKLNARGGNVLRQIPPSVKNRIMEIWRLTDLIRRRDFDQS